MSASSLPFTFNSLQQKIITSLESAMQEEDQAFFKAWAPDSIAKDLFKHTGEINELALVVNNEKARLKFGVLRYLKALTEGFLLSGELKKEFPMSGARFLYPIYTSPEAKMRFDHFLSEEISNLKEYFDEQYELLFVDLNGACNTKYDCFWDYHQDEIFELSESDCDREKLIAQEFKYAAPTVLWSIYHDLPHKYKGDINKTFRQQDLKKEIMDELMEQRKNLPEFINLDIGKSNFAEQLKQEYEAILEEITLSLESATQELVEKLDDYLERFNEADTQDLRSEIAKEAKLELTNTGLHMTHLKIKKNLFEKMALLHKDYTRALDEKLHKIISTTLPNRMGEVEPLKPIPILTVSELRYHLYLLVDNIENYCLRVSRDNLYGRCYKTPTGEIIHLNDKNNSSLDALNSQSKLISQELLGFTKSWGAKFNSMPLTSSSMTLRYHISYVLRTLQQQLNPSKGDSCAQVYKQSFDNLHDLRLRIDDFNQLEASRQQIRIKYLGEAIAPNRPPNNIQTPDDLDRLYAQHPISSEQLKSLWENGLPTDKYSMLLYKAVQLDNKELAYDFCIYLLKLSADIDHEEAGVSTLALANNLIQGTDRNLVEQKTALKIYALLKSSKTILGGDGFLDKSVEIICQAISSLSGASANVYENRDGIYISNMLREIILHIDLKTSIKAKDLVSLEAVQELQNFWKYLSLSTETPQVFSEGSRSGININRIQTAIVNALIRLIGESGFKTRPSLKILKHGNEPVEDERVEMRASFSARDKLSEANEKISAARREAEHYKQESADSKKESADSKKKAVESDKKAEHYKQEATYSKQEAVESDKKAVESDKKAEHYKQEATDSKQEAADSKQEAADSKQEAADSNKKLEASEGYVQKLLDQLELYNITPAARDNVSVMPVAAFAIRNLSPRTTQHTEQDMA